MRCCCCHCSMGATFNEGLENSCYIFVSLSCSIVDHCRSVPFFLPPFLPECCRNPYFQIASSLPPLEEVAFYLHLPPQQSPSFLSMGGSKGSFQHPPVSRKKKRRKNLRRRRVKNEVFLLLGGDEKGAVGPSLSIKASHQSCSEEEEEEAKGGGGEWPNH